MVDVSVVVPTHDRLPLLAQATDSILHQRGVSLELIVVNDGSTDGTRPWLDRMAQADPRVRAVHHERPLFVSAARNAGASLATGSWVAFCDDDDLWAPEKLSCQLAALRESNARWSCAGVVIVDDRLGIVGHHHVEGGPALHRLLEVNTIPTGSSVVAETELVRELGGFDPMMRGSEDWDLWIRLAQRSPLAAVDRPMVAYRLGQQSLSMNIGQMRASRSVIAERYAALATKHGASCNVALHEAFLAKQLLRAGAGVGASSILATLAIRHRRWRQLIVAAAALIAPRLTDRVGWSRAASRVPAAWRRDAETWLQPFRGACRRNESNRVLNVEPGARHA